MLVLNGLVRERGDGLVHDYNLQTLESTDLLVKSLIGGIHGSLSPSNGTGEEGAVFKAANLTDIL